MFLFPLELARDALNLEGYTVIGAYLSPVNDAYKKKVFTIFYFVRWKYEILLACYLKSIGKDGFILKCE